MFAVETKVVEQQCKTSEGACADFRAHFYLMISVYLQNCDCDLKSSFITRWKTLGDQNTDPATEIGHEQKMLNIFASELKAPPLAGEGH